MDETSSADDSRAAQEAALQDEVVRRYAAGGSIRAIAGSLWLSRPRVRKLLANAGVVIEPRGRGRTRSNVRLPRPPELMDRLLDLYVVQRMTRREVAETLGVPESRVRTWLEELEIRRRTRGAWNREDRVRPNPAFAEKLYVENEMTAREVGGRLSARAATVLDTLHERGAPVRVPNSTRAHILLDELYTDGPVLDTLARHGVPVVTEHGPVNERFPVPVSLDAALLHELYVGCGLSVVHIELVTGQPADTVRKQLRRYGVRLRTPGGLSPFSRRARRRSSTEKPRRRNDPAPRR